MPSARPLVITPIGFAVWMTSVVSLGAWMPLISLAFPLWKSLTPVMSP